MRCPQCERFCFDAFGLSAHMSQEHPICSPAPFAHKSREIRQFPPIQAMCGGFPGVDIDAIHRNPKYGPPKR